MLMSAFHDPECIKLNPKCFFLRKTMNINFEIAAILPIIFFPPSGESQQQCGHVDPAYLGTFAGLPAGHSWHPHTCTAHEGQRAGAH